MVQAPLLDVDPYMFRDHTFVQPVSYTVDGDELAPNHANIQQPGDQVATEELGPNASIQQSDDQAATEELGSNAIIQQSDDQAAIEELGSNGKDLFRFYRPLYEAALDGNWESAEKFFIQHPDADMTVRVNLRGMTILHVAANMGHAVFIHKLLRSGIFPKAAMKLLDDYGWTALHYAATFGSLTAVKDLVSEDSSLTQTLDNLGCSPLLQAANHAATRKVIWYLAKKTTNEAPPAGCYSAPFTGVIGAYLITSLAAVGYYDICLYMFNRYPQLADDSVKNWQRDYDMDLILSLANRSSDFPSGSTFSFWERCIYPFIPIEALVSIRSDSEKPDQSQHESSRIISKLAKVIIHWTVGAALKATVCVIIHWTVGAALKATVCVPGFKRIRDEKYKLKCITELLKVTCKIMSRWDLNDIVTYFQARPIHYRAAENGGIEILRALIKHFPHVMDNILIETNILLKAITNRREHIFNLMMERGVSVKLLPQYANTETQDNFLHVAAKLAPYFRVSAVSCPALQMQRELQWFKGVEQFVRPSSRILLNKDGKNPRELFTTEHKELVRDAERWMKDTSNSCMVVATLIITVVFAAAFTIPGGNIDGTGIPLFLKQSDFMVFVVSDAVGMFSSATSILMFLSILTARYAEDDFLRALPKRLILGLASLFIAIASMMVAFGATLYMVLHPGYKWIIFPIIGLACIPVGLFILLQLPLFIYMVRSTYGPSILMAKKTSLR